MTAGVLTAALLFAAAPAPEGLPNGRRLLLDCEKQFLRIESLKGTLRTRSVVHGGKSEPGPVSERRSDYLYARFDRVRIENAAPLEHTVIWNGKTLWIWSPRENAAVEQATSKVSALSRTMLSVQPGFGIDLLAPIPLDAYRAEATAAAPEESGDVVVTLTPVDKAVPRATMQLVVDTARTHVTRMLVLTERGTVLSDLRLTKPVEAKPGIWFATQIEVRQLLDDGSTLEELRTWERLAFDMDVDPSRFEFTVPDGATRVPVESLAPAGRGDVQ